MYESIVEWKSCSNLHFFFVMNQYVIRFHTMDTVVFIRFRTNAKLSFNNIIYMYVIYLNTSSTRHFITTRISNSPFTPPSVLFTIYYRGKKAITISKHLQRNVFYNRKMKALHISVFNNSELYSYSVGIASNEKKSVT